MRRIACVACLVALVAVGPGAAPSRASGIELVRADAAAARRVVVTGPRVRRILARRLLPTLGSDSGVRRLGFAWKQRMGPWVTIRVRTRAPHDRVASMRAWWFGTALAGSLALQLERRGLWLRGSSVVIDGRADGGGSGAVLAPSPQRLRPRPLAAEVEQRAEGLGLAVSGRVLPYVPAMLELRVRLGEGDLFAEPQGWGARVERLLPRGWDARGRRRYALLLVVEDPTGRLISASAGAASAGSSTSGEAGPVPSVVPPAELLDGETRLTVRFTRDELSGLLRERTVELVCGAAPGGVPDAAAVCEGLLRDRWALFGYLDGGCIGGGFGSPYVKVSGVVDGRTVERELGQCGSPAVQRWGDLFGIDPWRFT